MSGRPLTQGERALVHAMFGSAVDCDRVTIRRRKWFFFHPLGALMAPMGHIYAHPKGRLWSTDYSQERVGLQALFLHEMVHVWQAQTRGKFYLPLMRHPFCRYRYTFDPEKAFEDYGLEQQAEIVRHVFLLRNGLSIPDSPPRQRLEEILPFGRRA